MEYCTFPIEDLTPRLYERAYAMMDSIKRDRVDRMRFEEDKKRSVAGDYLARCLISRRFSVVPESVALTSSASGKPVVLGPKTFISISHSGDYALCALSEKPVGADIEKLKKSDERVIRRVCSDAEIRYITEKNTDFRFFQLWTLKEAYAKARGTGVFTKEIKTDFVLTDNIRTFKTQQGVFHISYLIPGYIISICELHELKQN
ncbi:MAG: 4'-phosphopantetheinyl transferase superfamily protein [Clostridiales bacterium]|nr:4'-phosphopantetheinyl transferase superfamily protein [Clostridiales bacterium]